jgi:hypothetical protein
MILSNERCFAPSHADQLDRLAKCNFRLLRGLLISGRAFVRLRCLMHFPQHRGP